MDITFFLQQYIANPKSIGAILPSSKFLADKMLNSIDFKSANCIVEYGPGSGVFTDKLLEKRENETAIIIIEKNYMFYKVLERKYRFIENLYVFYGSAENIDLYMQKIGISSAEYIISGLPFTSMNKVVSTNIFKKTCQMLKNDGKFIAFQYSCFKKSDMQKYFENINIQMELRNLPPAFVFTCSNSVNS